MLRTAKTPPLGEMAVGQRSTYARGRDIMRTSKRAYERKRSFDGTWKSLLPRLAVIPGSPQEVAPHCGAALPSLTKPRRAPRALSTTAHATRCGQGRWAQ